MKRIYGGFVMKSRINISILLIILGVLSTAFAQADYEYEYLSDCWVENIERLVMLMIGLSAVMQL